MTQNLNCPNCSALLGIPERPDGRLRCPYCHSWLMKLEDSLVKPPEIAGVTGGTIETTSRAGDGAVMGLTFDDLNNPSPVADEQVLRNKLR
jgi:hypothetical protein